MNKNIFLLLCLFIIPSVGLSQERYLDEIFEEVIITEDVIYGNAPDLPFIFLFEWNTFDMDLELNVQKTCYESIDSGIINSAHDLSDGGLSVAIAESVISSLDSLGAYINIESKLSEVELFFGECESIIIVTIKEEDLLKLINISKNNNIRTETIGRVTNDSKLIINDSININKLKLQEIYNNSLDDIMNQKNDE